MSPSNDNATAIAVANNKFTTQLFAHISKADENVVVSSVSIHTILSLLSQGSNTDTEESFMTVLNLSDKSSTAEAYHILLTELNTLNDVTLEIANRIFLQKRYALKSQFQEVALKKFLADAEHIDFEESNAAATINNWVEGKTNKKIRNLVQPEDLDNSTRMVLVNAIYFKGGWQDKFDATRTNDGQFFVAEDRPMPCKMMHRSGRYSYKEDSLLDAQVIEIPYKNKQLSMVIVLPKTKHQIADLENKLASYDLNLLMNHMAAVKVNLSLPRFKIEMKNELNEPLKKMGLSVAFGDDANFSDLIESDESLKISKVLHKAFIEVNEEGAEAAAATGAIMMMRCMPMREQSWDFCADHPFIFFIVYKNTSTIKLFSGKLNRFNE